MNISLFVISHRKLDSKLYKDRTIFYVGPKANELKKEGDFNDFSSDNIASKNFTYCECSAMYWLYKNYKCDIIGIEHYRRLFCYPNKKLKGKEYFVKELEKYDVIVMPNWFYFVRMDFWFKKNHGKEYFEALKKGVEDLYPSYLKDFIRTSHQWGMSACNMMVLKKDLYDKYCKFLFDILFYVEKNIEIPKDKYNSRMMGFMAELLLDTYIRHNKLKKKQSLVLMNDRYKK